MQIQAKNDRLLVRILPDKLSEILEVPRDTSSRLIKGEVLSIGPKVRSDVAVGECVVFTQACRDLKTIQFDQDLLLVRDEDLAGIVPRDVRVTDGRSSEM